MAESGQQSLKCLSQQLQVTSAEDVKSLAALRQRTSQQLATELNEIWKIQPSLFSSTKSQKDSSRNSLTGIRRVQEVCQVDLCTEVDDNSNVDSND